MIVINDDTRDSQVQNKKKDTQQDTKIASLQAAVDSINAQIEAINTSLSALSSSIDDKYSAQTQTLMSALTSQINALSESLSAVVTTGQVNADYGNFERLAVTLSATMANVAATVLNVSSVATLFKAEVTTLEAVNGTVSNLVATEATLQRAVIDSLSIVGSFSIRTLSAKTATFNGLNSIEIKASQKVDAPKIIADVVTGRTWHTPIGTPDNTELLKITIRNYEGIIQVQTEDDEFNVSVFNNALVSWTEKTGYLFRIQRTGNATELYLQNIGDTVDYRLLFIGSEDTVVPTSEIVDKTGIRQNVLTFNGVYGAGGGEGGSGSQIIFVDELPSVGEEGIIYLSKTLGAWVWNEDDGELVPLTGTDLPEAVQTNTENIGDLSDLTTTADSDLVSAINELDSHADTNAGAIATINGNDTGLSMREVAQDVASNVYIPCGSVAFANLPALSGARIGDVYNVTDSFTTTSDFIEGAGHVIPAGSNVAVVDDNNVKKWDVLGSMVDLSAYYTKAQTNALLDEKTDLTVVAPSFSDTTSYAVGDFVIYNGKLYQCTTAHSSGAWNNSHFTEKTVAELASQTGVYMAYTNPVGEGSFSMNRMANTSRGRCSATLGEDCTADGEGGIALGYRTRAEGQFAHAENYFAHAKGRSSHAEGAYSWAKGRSSHAEGEYSWAEGDYSHAEGAYTNANGNYSHAEGAYTNARENQHVQGRYNVLDDSTTPVYADIVGNGTADNDRKNIEATTWTGDKRLKGNVYAGCNDDSTGGDCLARENMIANAFSDTVSYAVGDYVTYNNALYRCTTAHTAGVWVSGHFTAVTVGGQLKVQDISSSITTRDGYASGQIHAYRDGNTVQVLLISVQTTAYGRTICSGLPKPLHNGYFCAQADGVPQELGLGVLIDDGSIFSGSETAGLGPSKVWDGFITYLTRD